ncbi:hypothetical protein GCM10027342_17180 [Photobacterium alginatilyticum]
MFSLYLSSYSLNVCMVRVPVLYNLTVLRIYHKIGNLHLFLSSAANGQFAWCFKASLNYKSYLLTAVQFMQLTDKKKPENFPGFCH